MSEQTALITRNYLRRLGGDLTLRELALLLTIPAIGTSYSYEKIRRWAEGSIEPSVPEMYAIVCYKDAPEQAKQFAREQLAALRPGLSLDELGE